MQQAIEQRKIDNKREEASISKFRLENIEKNHGSHEIESVDESN